MTYVQMHFGGMAQLERNQHFGHRSSLLNTVMFEHRMMPVQLNVSEQQCVLQGRSLTNQTK